jgi:hypothetical protein
MGDFTRWGMTMRTPAGPVDLVPLFRRLEGDKEVRVVDDEREAAVLALTHLEVPVTQVTKVLNMAPRDVKAALQAHGMKPVYAPELFAWTGVAQTSSKQRRDARLAERIIVDGRPFHQDAPHGTDLAYTEYGCHCEQDRAAHAAKLRADRDKKRMAAAA